MKSIDELAKCFHLRRYLAVGMDADPSAEKSGRAPKPTAKAQVQTEREVCLERDGRDTRTRGEKKERRGEARRGDRRLRI
jgi:hypothetical protein